GVSLFIKPINLGQLVWTNGVNGLNIANGNACVVVSTPTTLLQNQTGGIDLSSTNAQTALGDASGHNLIILANGDIISTNSLTSVGANSPEVIIAAGDMAATFTYGLATNSTTTTPWLVLGQAANHGGDIYLPNLTTIGGTSTSRVLLSAHIGDTQIVNGVTIQSLGAITVKNVTTAQSPNGASHSIYAYANQNINGATFTSDYVNLLSNGANSGLGGKIGQADSYLNVNSSYFQVSTGNGAWVNLTNSQTNVLPSQAGPLSLSSPDNITTLGPSPGLILRLEVNRLTLHPP